MFVAVGGGGALKKTTPLLSKKWIKEGRPS